MKEKIIENFLKLLAVYKSFNVTLIEEGKYRIRNHLAINGLGDYYSDYCDVVINIKALRISVNRVNADCVNLIWADHIDDIIKQLEKPVRNILNRIIMSEDADRMQKSRECRAGIRLKQMMEVTA